MVVSDSLYELLPATGFLLTLTASVYLVAMRHERTSGTPLAAIYVQHIVDLAYGASLFYAGFHGILVSVNSHESDRQPLIHCLFTSLHLHVWCFVDAATLALICISSLDQFICFAWNRRHSASAPYYSSCFLATLLAASSLTLFPAWMTPVELASNRTITISPFCPMDEAFGMGGDEGELSFYEVELAARSWVPLAAIAVLVLAALVFLALQLRYCFSYKLADCSTSHAFKVYSSTLIRCVLLALGVQLPLLMGRLRPIPKASASSPSNSSEQELAIRATTALLLGLVQPTVAVLLVPRYAQRLMAFFNPHDSHRTWQGVDDPPASRTGPDGIRRPPIDFGSTYSIAGNIMGEAGIPYSMELDADVQRSVSFFYG